MAADDAWAGLRYDLPLSKKITGNSFEPPDFFIEDPKGVEVVDGALNPGDDVSTTYEAAAKKTTTQGGGGLGGGRRMGGPPI